uniref:Putative secreted protein n=1 Tax=Ixodes ricinus TaxID=34613 RepID=A0A6B0V172_IXORI
MSDWLVQRLLVLARSLTGEMTSSDAPDASSLSPSEPIRGCSCTTPVSGERRSGMRDADAEKRFVARENRLSFDPLKLAESALPFSRMESRSESSVRPSSLWKRAGLRDEDRRRLSFFISGHPGSLGSEGGGLGGKARPQGEGPQTTLAPQLRCFSRKSVETLLKSTRVFLPFFESQQGVERGGEAFKRARCPLPFLVFKVKD